MNFTLLLALIAVIVGIVLGIKNGEYKGGVFWLVVSIVLLLVLPQLVTISVHA
jgi:hypothetical protein